MDKVFDIYKHSDVCRFVLGNNVVNPLICIGINPSIAKDTQADPTMKKLLQIAKHNKYNGLVMLNLSPEISTNPKEITQDLPQSWHKENLKHIAEVFHSYNTSDILACWGDNIAMRPYLPTALQDIYKLTQDKKWLSIETLTKKGNPRHPLYMRKISMLYVFDIHSYIKNLLK